MNNVKDVKYFKRSREKKFYVSSHEISVLTGIRHDNLVSRFSRIANEVKKSDVIKNKNDYYYLVSVQALECLINHSNSQEHKRVFRELINNAPTFENVEKKDEQLRLFASDSEKTEKNVCNSPDDYSDLTDNLVETQNGETLVTSRQIAYRFEKRHDNVIQNINEIIKAEKSVLTMFHQGEYISGTGKHYKQFSINRDGFSLLVMGFTGKKALEWKIKFIKAFNEMEAKLNGQKNIPVNMDKVIEAYQLPRTRTEAIAMLLDFSKKQDELEAENKAIKITNEEIKPKADAYDAAMGDNGKFYSVKDVADTIAFEHMGQKNLFKFMRDIGMIIDSYRPYRHAVEQGFLKVHVSEYYPNGRENRPVYQNQIRVSGKGIAYIIKKLKERGYKEKFPDLAKDNSYESRKITMLTGENAS